MRDASRALLVALNFVILDAPARFGSPGPSVHAAATLLLLLVNIALLFGNRPSASAPSTHTTLAGVAAAAVAALLVFAACADWLDQLLFVPIDAQRADMLVVIEHGIRRLLQGHNPYTIYKVPWDATLPYGPVMWAPYIAPYLAHADIRFVSAIGFVFVPLACAFAVAGLALDGRHALAAAWLAPIAAIAFSRDLRAFASIAHTPAYWPLLAAFAWLVARERWYAAAIAAGLLIVARTTMVAVAPVFLLAVWYRRRDRFAGATALVIASAVLPFLPFAIADPGALAYALYGSYQSLMKGFVWTSTTWAHQTIGITGMLLRSGLSRWVEPVQVAMMLATYAIASRALARGALPAPWMGLALLVFSMTTLWPVGYIYVDVFLLAVCSALAETEWFERIRPLAFWTAVLATAFLIVGAVAWISIPRDPVVDVGAPSDRRFLYSGFADDERADRSFAWVDGDRATVLLPRRTRRDAEIEMTCQPNLPTPAATQTMSAALNGIVLGTVSLREGWQSIVLPAPARAWQIGVNQLTLTFSSAVSPLEAGISADARRLSVAFDRLTVRTK